MKRRIGILLVMVLAVFALVGCGGSEAPAETPQAEATEESKEVATLEEAFADQPVVLTSAGQSADVKMIESLIKKTDISYTIDTVLPADGLGEAKTLIVAIGGSSKGLGAAGIDAEDEIERINAVIDEAEAQGLSVIGMHVGGEGRRGELSDKFINATASRMDYLVVVEGGNADGLFSEIAADNSIPMEVVASIADSFGALQKAFK